LSQNPQINLFFILLRSSSGITTIRNTSCSPAKEL
jgi:hypothetical protein